MSLYETLHHRVSNPYFIFKRIIDSLANPEKKINPITFALFIYLFMSISRTRVLNTMVGGRHFFAGIQS